MAEDRAQARVRHQETGPVAAVARRGQAALADLEALVAPADRDGRAALVASEAQEALANQAALAAVLAALEVLPDQVVLEVRVASAEEILVNPAVLAAQVVLAAEILANREASAVQAALVGRAGLVGLAALRAWPALPAWALLPSPAPSRKGHQPLPLTARRWSTRGLWSAITSTTTIVSTAIGGAGILAPGGPRLGRRRLPSLAPPRGPLAPTIVDTPPNQSITTMARTLSTRATPST
ncbi:MAG: hypothetical protein ACJ8FY_02130 [Gemmataceae bacterium]